MRGEKLKNTGVNYQGREPVMSIWTCPGPFPALHIWYAMAVSVLLSSHTHPKRELHLNCACDLTWDTDPKHCLGIAGWGRGVSGRILKFVTLFTWQGLFLLLPLSPGVPWTQEFPSWVLGTAVNYSIQDAAQGNAVGEKGPANGAVLLYTSWGFGPRINNCSSIFLCNWAENQAEKNGSHNCEPFHMGHIRACCRPGLLLGRSDLWHFIILLSSALKIIKNWIFLWGTQIHFIKIPSLGFFFLVFSYLFIYLFLKREKKRFVSISKAVSRGFQFVWEWASVLPSFERGREHNPYRAQ